MEVAYIETIKGLVKAGLGLSILPDKAVEQEISGGILVKSKIQDATFSRNLGVVYLKDKFLSRSAVEFLRFLVNRSKTVCSLYKSLLFRWFRDRAACQQSVPGRLFFCICE